MKKEKISELEDLVMEAIQYETQEKKTEINECISELWDYLKQPNTHAIGTLREEYDKEITMNMHP